MLSLQSYMQLALNWACKEAPQARIFIPAPPPQPPARFFGTQKRYGLVQLFVIPSPFSFKLAGEAAVADVNYEEGGDVSGNQLQTCY